MNNTVLVILLVVLFAVVLISGGVYLASRNNPSMNGMAVDNSDSGGNTNNGGINGGTDTGGNTRNSGTGSGSQEMPQTYRLDIANFAFSNKQLRIKQGDTVIWTNKDSARHTVTSDSGSELDSELLADGESYSHTFSQKGSFAYHCTPHPNMKGKIIVE